MALGGGGYTCPDELPEEHMEEIIPADECVLERRVASSSTGILGQSQGSLMSTPWKVKQSSGVWD